MSILVYDRALSFLPSVLLFKNRKAILLPRKGKCITISDRFSSKRKDDWRWTENRHRLSSKTFEQSAGVNEASESE